MRGFALLELILVIALIILVSSLTLPTLIYFDRFIVHNELDQLYLHFLALQQEATLTGSTARLVFDTKKNTYICGSTNYSLSPKVHFGVLPSVKGPPAAPQSIIKQAVTFPHQTVTFYPDGIIQAGTVYLANQAQTILYALTVSVAQVSYIRCYRYDKNNHKWIVLADS